MSSINNIGTITGPTTTRPLNEVSAKTPGMSGRDKGAAALYLGAVATGAFIGRTGGLVNAGLSGALLGWLVLGGVAFKKAFIREDDSTLKKLGVGLLTFPVLGWIPYAVAEPKPSRARELAETKASVVQARYANPATA
ncbi:MAG: hypothetical protein IPK13_02620 [Deltaproteobacteria bacterium]|nr:hypothetical protein [Deltaproteobacteria bacterium]